MSYLFIYFVYFCFIIGNRLLGKIEWAWNFNWAHIYYYLKLSKYNLNHEKHLHLCSFPYVCFNHNNDNDESITKIILFGQQSTVWSLVWLVWSDLPYLAIHIFISPYLIWICFCTAVRWEFLERQREPFSHPSLVRLYLLGLREWEVRFCKLHVK